MEQSNSAHLIIKTRIDNYLMLLILNNITQNKRQELPLPLQTTKI